MNAPSSQDAPQEVPPNAVDVGGLREFLSVLPIALFAYDCDGVSILSEGGLLGPLGLEPGEAVGWRLDDVAARFPHFSEYAGRCLQGESFVVPGTQADGVVLDTQWRPRRAPDGRIVGFVGLATAAPDGASGSSVERAHRDYRALLNALPDHIFRLHPDGTVVTIKPSGDPEAAQPALAWAPRPLTEVVPVGVAELLTREAAAVTTSGAERLVEYAVGPGASAEQFEARLLAGPRDQVLVVVQDVTERRAEEARVRQASKMEALGRLAAGVAHEINTPIQFVSNNVEFMSQAFGSMHDLLVTYREALSGSDPRPWAERAADLAAREQELDVDFLLGEVPQAVDETLQGMRRVSAIVRAMKVFSHPSARELVEADINEAVSNAVIVSASHHKLVADVSLQLGDLPPVVCVVGEVTQVLLNLVINAAQAVEGRAVNDGVKGSIELRTWVDGDFVVVAVSDDGEGIAHADQPRVFEAFYTTKDVGVGTGQGLSLAWSIVVEKHAGRLDVRSEPGEGTTFEMRLPIAGPPQAGEHEELAGADPVLVP